MRQYEELKKKLASEGLFEQQHKRAVPSQARHIGLITSPTGAAVRDAISVIRRRSPSSEVTLFPVQVQGEQAPGQLVNAIQAANQFGQCDVLLLIRGGGSLEDLWCFNDEQVARAIFASNCPVVSGVGHEIDTTIADFVADYRAPTPSVAAERVTMDQHEIMSRFDQLQARLLKAFARRIGDPAETVTSLVRRLGQQHPQRHMQALRERLELSSLRLTRGQQARTHLLRSRLLLVSEQLRSNNPSPGIRVLQTVTANLNQQLARGIRHRLENHRHQLVLQASALDNLSPLKTLSRGFAVVRKNERVVTSAKQLAAEDKVDITFEDGDRKARII